MVKYRFKTEQEFKAGGLWDYKLENPNGWNFRGGMNKYLGQDIPEEYNQKCSKNQGFDLDEWFFGNEDYVLKEKETLKFKKDKWYKWYQKNHGSFHYGKFDSIINTSMKMKPWIMHCDSYNETGSFDIDNAEQITEVSYSEIEQFLPEDMKETKDFPKYWFVKNNIQPELLEYAGYISKESPAWWKPFPYIGYDGVYCCNGMHGCPQSSFINDAVEVSFEDFLENIYYVKFPKKRKQKSEFVLPEKWCIQHSKEVGRWFDEVYFKKPKLPIINKYEGKYHKDSHISYGCAELPLEWFMSDKNRSMTSITLNSGAVLSKSDIEQIKEYLIYQNNK